MSPEVAAALFDSLGEVDWFVVDRATFTGLRIKQLERPVAKLLKQHYRGTVYTKKHTATWVVAGRDSELFAAALVPHLQEKKSLIELYLLYRDRIINADGRGRASTLDEISLAMRKEIEYEFAQLQGKEN